ncbi:uncharacterized protein LOC127731126 isoform X11 [Mytilus californianus]|uniref:uncharacterized protein LOC127731126 isoform X11 n=1 Tax=Mytilus californianus TaxID=6549 RepID=UPI002248742E|nr:uncharacterized protein LOC127731126 isoform X11 [Mytilus californianus]
MSKCPISWNVPVDTGHNFFFTQETFNKYSKPETYEEKIRKRYELFPPRECHLGVNAKSKRSKKKVNEKKTKSWDKEDKESLYKVQSLSDASEEEEELIFDVEEDFEEFGVVKKITPKQNKQKEKAKTRGQKVTDVVVLDTEKKEALQKNKFQHTSTKQSDTQQKHTDDTELQQTQPCIEDLEEFGVEKAYNTEKKEPSAQSVDINQIEEFGIPKTISNQSDILEGSMPGNQNHQQKESNKEQKKRTEEFPWDTKSRDRKSDKADSKIFRYQNRKSNLNSREQSRYLNLHYKYNTFTPKSPSEREKREMKDFMTLHERVIEEQKEYQQYLEKLAHTAKSDYNYLAPEADRYFKERLAMKKKRVQLYPQYYNVCDKLNLLTTGPPCQLLFVMSLLELGTVPKLVVPNMNVGERPRIPLDYDSIAKHCPCDHNKPSNVWNNQPCSKDQNCDVLSQRSKVHITISASAIACIVNNHAPNYNREWEIPFTVKDYQLQDGDKKFMHRVVYIDNPLPAKELTGRDKNTMFYKYALRSHMGRLNQTGHIFTLNQKIESDSTSPESLKLPRKQSSVEQSHNTELIIDDTENVASLLSPIKSPSNEQKKKMSKIKRGEKVKDCEEVVGDDPFGTMEVSMEDLETFGMDMSANKTFKKLGEKKNVTSSKEDPPVEINLAAEKKLPAKDGFIVGKAIKGQVSDHSETLKSNELDISKGKESLDSVQEVSSLSSDGDCKIIDLDNSEKEKGKLAENFQSPKIIGNNEEVDRIDTSIPNVKSDLNVEDSVSNSVEISDSFKIDESSVKTSESVSNDKEPESIGQELKVDIVVSSQPCDLQMSSASDDESDALVIDEPENENIKTVSGHVAMETPASPVPETPLSPVLFGSSFGSAFSPPASPSKRLCRSIDMNDRTPRCSFNSVDGVKSPDRMDRNSPTSPDHTTFSSPESKPCKIIPLQRDSEEEFVTDNSNVLPHPINLFYPGANINQIGLRKKVEEISDSEGNTESKPSIDISSAGILSKYNTSDDSFKKVSNCKALDIKTLQLSDDTTVLKSDLHTSSITKGDEVRDSIDQSEPDSLCLIKPMDCTDLSVQNQDSNTSSSKIIKGISHNVEGDSQNVEGGSHNVEGDSHNVEGDSHNVEGDSHNVEGDSHNVEGDSHNVEGDSHNVEGDSHNVEGDSHNVEGDSHNVEGDSHNVEGDSHNVEGGSHNVERDSHNVEGDSHNVEGDSHNVEGDSHNVEGDSHNVEGDSYNVEGGSQIMETGNIDNNTGKDDLDSSDNEILQINTVLSKDGSDSSDEFVSPRSKILRKNKDRNKKCDGQTNKFRAAVIESDSESDEEVGSKQHSVTDKCSSGTISPFTSSETNDLGKRPLSRCNSTENEEENEIVKRLLQPSQRKGHRSNKSKDVKTEVTINVEAESENLEEMACTRRKTRSSVGLKKQETTQNTKTLKLPSSPKKFKSVDDHQLSDFCEESMLTKRQTRRSMDNQDQEQRSSKLAILDRVKKNLRSKSTSQETSTEKQTDNTDNEQLKRKRGRPQKRKSVQEDIHSIDESASKSEKQDSEMKVVEGSIEEETTQLSNEKDITKLTMTKSMANQENTYTIEVNMTDVGDSNDGKGTENQQKSSVCNFRDKDQNTGDDININHQKDILEKGKSNETEPAAVVKTQSQKVDTHVKKAKTLHTTVQKGQQKSVNPLENILQAQERLLDNPKLHRDQAQQEYFSQFKFPARHNVTYHLWSLGAYKVMIRSGYHGVYKDPQQKVSFIHVSPKMEYQSNYGVEQLTVSEVSKDWASAYVRPNCKIIRARVNPLQSDIVSMKEEELNKMSTMSHGYNPANGFQMLANVFHRLHQCSPGQYLLHHSPGSSECQIKKATENNKRGTYDLHMNHFGLLGGEKDSHQIPWIPIDTNFIQQRFHKKGRIPATFEPRDYKPGTKKKKKRGKH